MTVCIGLVCSSGKRILLSADTRASYGAATSNDQTAKLFDLPAHFCGAVAGTLSQCEDAISELYHRMAQIPDSEIAPEQVRRCIVDSYDQIYTELADQALRNDLRITLNQYKHDKKLHVCQFQTVSTEGFTPKNCAITVTQSLFSLSKLTSLTICVC